MSTSSNSKKKETSKKNNSLEPDPETLHKTDPQENMQGPISTIVQNIKEAGEENDKETKEEADKKKDKNT
jgi:hypothetical protein